MSVIVETILARQHLSGDSYFRVDQREPMDATIIQFLKAQSRNLATVWTVATFGAIAEFHRTETVDGDIQFSDESLTINTAQGGVRVSYNPRMKAVAYETLSKVPELWSHGVSICLPTAHAVLSGNKAITALGSDTDALLESDRDYPFFDLGLGAPHMDACVRVHDPALAERLQQSGGKRLFEDCPELVRELVHISPARVFRSAMARIEVRTRIPLADDITPDGAHTHILPDLLAHGRTHAATVPIPAGWLPVLNLFPPNPLRDEAGKAKVFDPQEHRDFQNIMRKFANPGVMSLKDAVCRAIEENRGPAHMKTPDERHLRTALRVVLRQLRQTHGPSGILERWVAAFDTNPPNGADDLDAS